MYRRDRAGRAGANEGPVIQPVHNRSLNKKNRTLNIPIFEKKYIGMYLEMDMIVLDLAIILDTYIMLQVQSYYV